MSHQLFKSNVTCHLPHFFHAMVQFFHHSSNRLSGRYFTAICKMLHLQLNQRSSVNSTVPDSSLGLCAVLQAPAAGELTETDGTLLKGICERLMKDYADCRQGASSLLVTEALANFFVICVTSDLQVVTIDNEKSVQAFVRVSLANVGRQVSQLDEDQRAMKSKVFEKLVAQLVRNLGCLNNFCWSNLAAKETLVENGVVAVVLQPLLHTLLKRKVFVQDYPHDLCKAVVDLLMTLTANCASSKVALVRGPPGNAVLQQLIDLCHGDAKVTKADRSFLDDYLLPTCFRVVIGTMTSPECRSFMLKKNAAFLQRGVDALLDLENSTLKKKQHPLGLRKAATVFLDLWLSFTAFSDGQTWASKHRELVDILARTAQIVEEDGTVRLASLAVLHNLSFNSFGRTRLLLSSEFLSGLKHWLKRHDEMPNANKMRSLAVRMTLNLGANSHKGKAALLQANVLPAIREIELSSAGHHDEEWSRAPSAGGNLTASRDKMLIRSAITMLST